MHDSQAPLSGLKVLDLTRMVAGPLATQVLADMGATVYKIERPVMGDDSRLIGPFLRDAQGANTRDSAWFMAYNRGKKSLTVDLSTPDGAQLVRRLAARCDVLVENFKVGALKKYGLAHDDLAPTCPRLVYCSITGFGMDGPYAERPGYDSITQGMAGLMSTNGPAEDVPGSEPLRTQIPISDVATGLYASNAILAAIHRRHLTNRGGHVDVSLFDASVSLNGHLAIEYLLTGHVPGRHGNINPHSGPTGAFACRDGRINISIGNNTQFDSLCSSLGLPRLSLEPDYATNTARAGNREKLKQLLEGKSRQKSMDELIELLSGNNIPCGKVLNLSQVFDDPQVIHRGLSLTVPHANATSVPSVRSPIRIEGQALPANGPPTLGEHTTEILEAELGLSPQDIDALRRAAIL